MFPQSKNINKFNGAVSIALYAWNYQKTIKNHFYFAVKNTLMY